MSETADRIQSDTRQAMRDRDKVLVDTLRLATHELKNAGIEKKGSQGLTREVASPADYLEESEVVQVLQKLLKRRREAARQFQEGGREDLAQRELAEAAVLEAYLPRGLDPAELEAMVRAAIEETGATSMKDMGAVMKIVVAQAAGRADGAAVSAAVRELLS
ncbi:MAG: GatB/YqeY domain-containing protein [Planctomycetes bacterium]|nr:GatB/YqeY domain-containing protein [Planctomycetota bacterium]MBL7008008.1 GatB/YqeY domain-containing protein [Planctomycetota bacterium]